MANRKITDLFSAVTKNTKPSSSLDSTESATGSSAETTTLSENVSHVLNEDFLCRPPKTFTFPKTIIGGRNRSCQHQWFIQFPWLIYETK